MSLNLAVSPTLDAVPKVCMGSRYLPGEALSFPRAGGGGVWPLASGREVCSPQSRQGLLQRPGIERGIVKDHVDSKSFYP